LLNDGRNNPARFEKNVTDASGAARDVAGGDLCEHRSDCGHDTQDQRESQAEYESAHLETFTSQAALPALTERQA